MLQQQITETRVLLKISKIDWFEIFIFYVFEFLNIDNVNSIGIGFDV